MEKLRKIVRRLGRANEKVVFALMVAVLIWRVVQIVYNPPKPIGNDGPDPVVPIDAGEREAMTSSQQDPARFANVSTAAFQIPGSGPQPVNTDEGVPADMPTISCTGTKIIGTTTYADLRVGDRAENNKKVGNYFARRRATLDEIDTDRGVMVFTWVANGKKYERRIGG